MIIVPFLFGSYIYIYMCVCVCVCKYVQSVIGKLMPKLHENENNSLSFIFTKIT